MSKEQLYFVSHSCSPTFTISSFLLPKYSRLFVEHLRNALDSLCLFENRLVCFATCMSRHVGMSSRFCIDFFSVYTVVKGTMAEFTEAEGLRSIKREAALPR